MLALLVSLSSLFLSAFSLQVVGVVNTLLDPLPISSWKKTWMANTIDLSSNNLGQTGVSVTFNVNLSTSLISGIVEVMFPTGFVLTGVSGASGQVVQQSLTAVAGNDIAVTVTGVGNPATAGPYGPFAVRTRLLASGQIIDANLNFGMVYITAAPSTLSQLSITLASGSTGTVSSSDNTLNLKFTISKDLWKHDLFRIKVSEYWTVSSSATCTSDTYSTRVNNFNGTSLTNAHYLDCIASTKVAGQNQYVYIYGLAVDEIDVSIEDNRYVSLLVGPVTTPDRSYTVVVYQWTVETMRFGTRTTIETGIYTSGPSIGPGIITALTWRATWIPADFNLVNGYQAFTDTLFSVTNPIPAGGSIVVTYTDAVAISSWSGVGCYLLIYISLTATCTATSSSSITIASLPQIAAGAQISFRAYSRFNTVAGGTAMVSTILTYDSTLNNIDKGANLGGLSVVSATSGKLASDFTVDFYNSLHATDKSTAGGTGDNTLFIHFKMTAASNEFVSTSTVSIFCPLASQAGDFSIYIPTTNRVDKWNKNTQAMDGTSVVFNSGGSVNGSTVSVTPGTGNSPGVIQFTIGTNMIPMTYIDATISVSSGSISLPYIINNPATAYECSFLLKDSTGTKVTQRFAKQFTITAQAWDTAAAPIFTYFCTLNLAGTPVRFDLIPKVIGLLAATKLTYYVEFELSSYPAYHGSGMTEGDSYPVQTSLSLVSPSMTVHNGGTNTVWNRLTGHGTVAASSRFQVYFPVGLCSAATANAKVRSFYYPDADKRTKFITHESSLLSYSTLTAALNAFVATSNISSPSVVNGDAVSSAGLSFNIRVSTALTATPASPSWGYFIFPAGFSWTTGRAALAAGTPFSATYFFTSPSLKFVFPGLLVQQITTAGKFSNTGSVITIYGLRYAIGYQPSVSVAVVSGDAAGTLTNACGNSSSSGVFTTIASLGAISPLTITPNSILAQGPGGVDVTHTLTFTLTHGIDASGYITLIIHSGWTTNKCTTCTVSGLTDFSTSAKVACPIASNTFTIKSFADFSSTRSTVVTVVIAHLLPPASPSTSGYAFVQTLVSYTSGGKSIDAFTPGTSNSSNVIVATPLTTGTSTFITKQTFPQNASMQAVDLYLRFSLSHSLPTCGTISISSPLAWKLPSGDSKNSCFMTGATYSDCTMSSTGLAVTLTSTYIAGAELELYCEAAVDNPSTAGTTATGFKVVSTWFGAVVDTDGSSITTKQLFTVAAGISSTISTSNSGTITVDPKNVGEFATYTFAFTSLLDLSPGRQLWVQFPQEYDYYIGAAEIVYVNDPGSYYLPCSIAGQDPVYCTIDHRTLLLSSSKTISAGTEIKLSVSNIRNPNTLTTNYFRLFLVDSSGSALAASTNFAQVKLVAAAPLLDIRSADATYPYFSSTSDYTFRAYFYLTVDANSEIHVLFPQEFALWRTSSSSIPCASTWVDDSTPTANHTPQTWNTASSCLVSGNRLILPSPATSLTFSANYIVSLTYNSILNPEFGQTRTVYSGAAWDFDAYDTDVWKIYPFWTSKFDFFVYDKSDTKKYYLARSYANLHAAYTGLGAAHKRILINGYNPQNKAGRIMIWAGTQTEDLYITTESSQYPCQSQSLTFTPMLVGSTASENISFSSVWNQFIMFQDDVQIAFRIAATSDTPKGLYYVQWKVSEVKQSGVTGTPYDAPAQTLIEVAPATAGKYQFKVATIPPVQAGVGSLPIAVEVTNAPCKDVTVVIGILNEPANVGVNPSSLRFLQDINSLTFQIIVNAEYDMLTGSSFNLTFNVTGTNSYSYSIIPQQLVNIIESTLLTDGEIFSLGLTTPTRTTVSFSPTTNEAGIIYYFLAGKGTAMPGFEMLRTRVKAEEAAKMEVLYHNVTYAVNETANKDTQPLSNETWSDFERRLYATHLQSTWVGSIAINPLSTTKTVTIDWLWAATSYQLLAYFDNMKADTTGSAPLIENFTTTASADCQPFTLVFQGLVNNPDFISITNAMAEYAGVNPLRIIPQMRTVSRRASDSTTTTTTVVTATSFTSTLLQNRFTEYPDPKTLLTLTDRAYAEFKTTLAARGIPNALTTMSLDAVPNRFLPQWKSVPSLGQLTTSSISVNFATYLNGETCCVALNTNTAYPTGEQVMLGLDSYNNLVPHGCRTNDLTISINTVMISNLGPASQYYVFCTSTDTYPVFPSQMQYADINQMQFLTAITPGITAITPGGTSAASILLLSLFIVISL